MRKLFIYGSVAALAVAPTHVQAQSVQSDAALINLLREAEANVKAVKARLKARNIVVKGKNVYRLVPIGDKRDAK